MISIPKISIGEDDLMTLILDAGAEDLKTEDDAYTVTCAPEGFEKVRKAVEAKGTKIDHAELQLIAENTVKVEGKDAESLLKLVEALEEHDDVQHVFSNFEIDDKVIANLATANE